ncbi:apolipoprotein N-acyltransferase [Panacibacter sp. DH6]|uniref:Apolipoprotein N-acyltransferase n=1 Tax=Panacibacter microcysteis TaxID=2793269 RepID=A0A931H029_9BACT|nr:apolipoprotein N-acyltransferase [Panacibacter microcysteis]MBG9378523.1 apolipoprotein N-acyltransferase [Panacibacter microcysteis]
MRSSFTSYILPAIVSGLLATGAATHPNFWLSWLYLVPLFFALVNAGTGNALRAGIAFGVALGLPSFYWMVPGAARFTGSSTNLYGIAVYVLSVVFLAAYFGFINWLFALLKQRRQTRFSFIADAVIVAAVYAVAEALYMNLTTGMPWFGFHAGNGLLANLYTIQPASVFGMHILSFVVVMVNYLLAYTIAKRKWTIIVYPAITACVYVVWGSALYAGFSKEQPVAAPVTVALLNQNIEPEIRWDDQNGNKLVAALFALDSIAAAQKPGVMMWSESAVPWTYRPDDDLVKEMLRISSAAGPMHLLGINTDFADNVVFNSVYAINKDGRVAGRYDKQRLLSFIEQDVAGLSFPFLSSGGFMVQPGAATTPLQTAYGSIGVMICNESTLPQAAAEPVRKGATWLANLSNDGWFRETYLADLHFWNVKLRAVECRRDVLVCSNNGYTGQVKATGEVALQVRDDQAFVKMVTVNQYDNVTLAAAYPFLFVYICAIGLVVAAVRNRMLQPGST